MSWVSSAFALLLGSVVLLPITQAAPVASKADAAKIPFEFEDGFIRIQARVAGSGEPLNLLLDSGAGVSVLGLRTARRLGLALGPAESVRGVGSEAAAYSIGPVHASAGSVELPAFTMAVDLSMGDALCGRPLDGLVGVEFFKDRVVEIDYAAHCLRLLDGVPASAFQSAVRLPIKERNGILCVPVRVNDSQSRWTRLDTGCNDSLHWVIPKPRQGREHQGVSVGFITNPKDTALTDVSLGSHGVGKVKTSLHGRELFEGEAGLLGNGLLSRFRVIVDWPHRQVLLENRDR